MQYHDGSDQERHGGMNHGMGMMLLGCGVPMAAIVLLPRMGVSPVAALIVGVVGMIVLHAGMTVVHRLKDRKAGNIADSMRAEHRHH